MIKNTLPHQLENLERFESFSTNGPIVGGDLLRACSTGCFIYSFVIQVISEKTLCSKYFTSSLRVFLHENNRNYNFYFSYKSGFIQLFVLFYKRKTKIRFSASWLSGNEKYFCSLFIVSRTLLQSHAKFNRLLESNFLTCYSC